MRLSKAVTKLNLRYRQPLSNISSKSSITDFFQVDRNMQKMRENFYFHPSVFYVFHFTEFHETLSHCRQNVQFCDNKQHINRSRNLRIADIKMFTLLSQQSLSRHRVSWHRVSQHRVSRHRVSRHPVSRTQISPMHCAEIYLCTVTLHGESNLVCRGSVNFMKKISNWVNEKSARVMIHPTDSAF